MLSLLSITLTLQQSVPISLHENWASHLSADSLQLIIHASKQAKELIPHCTHPRTYRLRVDDVAAGAKGREKLIPISLQHLMRRGHCEGPAVAATGIRRHLELHATWFTDFLRVTF